MCLSKIRFSYACGAGGRITCADCVGAQFCTVGIARRPNAFRPFCCRALGGTEKGLRDSRR